jgi:Family of unknown function (DUF6504)
MSAIMAGKYIAMKSSFQPFHWAPKNIESPTMSERFISEAIKPITEAADASRMAIGEPGLPREFVWRGQTVTVRAVLRSWRETGKCHHGSREMYVRKHWYEVATASGGTMKLYIQYQAVPF